MIQIRWKKFLSKTGVWLTTEILLNLIGLDNVADYSEFLFAQDLDLYKKNHRTVKVTEFPPQFCAKISEYCPLPGTVIRPLDLQAKCYQAKAQVLDRKCKKLRNSCIKVMCLDNRISRVDIAYSNND